MPQRCNVCGRHPRYHVTKAWRLTQDGKTIAEATAPRCALVTRWQNALLGGSLQGHHMAIKPAVSTRCTLCQCVSTAELHGFRVCDYHLTHGEDDPPCPTCEAEFAIALQRSIDADKAKETTHGRA